MKWDLIIMSIIYVFAGAMHFIKPKMYVKIIPKFLPRRRLLNLIAGGLEIILGVGLLIEFSRSYSAVGIVFLLTTFFIVHINMLRGKDYSAGVPMWILILRLPLQFVLIWWAYLYI